MVLFNNGYIILNYGNTNNQYIYLLCKMGMMMMEVKVTFDLLEWFYEE